MVFMGDEDVKKKVQDSHQFRLGISSTSQVFLETERERARAREGEVGGAGKVD